MKIVHYYASDDMQYFDVEQPDVACDKVLEFWMLDWVACEQAFGKPPWRLDIPREAVVEVFRNIPLSNLFDIRVVAGKSGSDDPAVLCHPIDAAIMRFDGVEAYIHYRRVLPFKPFKP